MPTSHLFTPANAEAFRIFGFWGALGSVLAFLAYFPYTKHIHIFGAPAKYLVAREPTSGVLPPVVLNLEAEDETENRDVIDDRACGRGSDGSKRRRGGRRRATVASACGDDERHGGFE